MKKNYNLNFLKNLFFFLAASIISLNSYSQNFSPTVGVNLSNLNCGQLADLSIDVSQDQGETDIASSVFTSDAGSFDLASVNVGDTLGTADMTLTSGVTINSTLIVGATSSWSTIVLSVDNSGTLGSFTLQNLTNGIEITATSPGDGNTTTGGYTSNATFNNLFVNPSTSVLTFSSTITSELGDVDNQSIVQFMGCADFSPSVNLILSNNDCGLLTDVTIQVSQDAGEIDMDASLFMTDGGSFDLASLSVGNMVGYATVTTTSNTYTTDLFVSSVSGSSATLVDNFSNSFLIENLSGGGVSVSATSPGDNNYTTSGNSSSVTLTNIYNNTSVGVLGFTSTITSEIGQVDNQSINVLMSCADFSPTVSTSLSNYDCDSLSSLTINVSQDAGETDMASALFVSDGGSFTISSMAIGDNIGSASFTNSLGTYNTSLYVSSLTGTTAVISDSLGNSFSIENLSGGGVSITATSPGDNNSLTGGNSSGVTFNNVFHNPTSGMLNFNSTITSELGEVDNQSFTHYMSCIDFSPTVTVGTSDNTCNTLTDLTIDVSQDAGEADIDSAVFVSDGGSFDITGLVVGDVVGSANVLFAGGTNVNSNLVLSTINTVDDFEVESVDPSGVVLGTFGVANLSTGGVSVIATSPADGNSSTNGYVSTATFSNLFVNPNTTLLNFTTTITSELGHVDIQSFSQIICCDPMLTVTITACDSYDWDGVTYDSTGMYTNVYTDVNGCDSTVTLDLTINYSSSSTVTVTACDSFDWDGMTYDSTGMYTNVYTDVNGCDSTVTLDLTINYSSSSTVTVTACDSFDWDGMTYDSTGMYTNVYAGSNGCDSTVTLDLTINYSSSSTVTATACDSFDWDGVTYDSTGMYTNVYTDVNGCDSTVTLDLTINYSSSSTVTVTACDSFDWDGVTYDSTGMYTNVYTGSNGCDSTVTLDLTINYSSSSTVTATACDSFDWDGMTYDSTGMYTNVYTGSNGCDSTVTLDLTINYSSSSTVTATACDSFDWDGVTYDSTGMYTNVYADVNGCDSTVTLDLTINYSSSSTVTVTACDSFDWDGMTYDSTGMYTNVYTGSNGCDSTVTLDLTINYSSSSTVTITACDSYDWDGVTYDSTGMYTNVYTDVNGCDSTVTLDLTIHDSPTDATVTQSGDTLSVIVSTGTPPYTYEWNTGETTQWILPDSSGTYWCAVTDSNGCQDWSNQYVYTSTDINDLDPSTLLLYPNPTSGLLNIEFVNNNIISLSIMNVLGDEIYNENLEHNNVKYSNQLDLSNYSNGIYFVKLRKIDSILTKKVILQ